MTHEEILTTLGNYVDYLIAGSSAEAPLWNIEKVRSGKPNKWNYVDGCMITACLSLYKTTGDEKFLKFSRDFVDYFVKDGGEIYTFDAKWAKIIAVRDDVKKVLEQARADKIIGSSLEAAVTLHCSDEMYDFLNAIPMDELADLMIVSHVDLVKGEGGVKGLTEGLGMSVAHAAGNKCLRCWKFDTAVGEDGLCPRCAKVLG